MGAPHTPRAGADRGIGARPPLSFSRACLSAAFAASAAGACSLFTPWGELSTTTGDASPGDGQPQDGVGCPCAPTQLASGQSGLNSIAVDPVRHDVYWTTEDAVMQCAPGCSAPETLASSADGGSFQTLAFGAGYLVWSNQAAPYQVFASLVALPDAGISTVTKSSPVFAVVVDPIRPAIYYTFAQGRVGYCPPSAAPSGPGLCNGFESIAIGFNLASPGSIAVGNSYVYFVTLYGIFECSALGGCPNAVRSLGRPSPPRNLTFNSGYLYWIEDVPGGGNAVVRVAKDWDAGTVETLWSGKDNVTAIAVSSDDVYFTETNAGRVMRVPLDGGAAVPIATAQGGPGPIAVDGTMVYWGNQDGTVMQACGACVPR